MNRIAQALIWMLAAGCFLPSLATSATLTVRQVGTMDTVISAVPTDTIDLELVLDTMGLTCPIDWSTSQHSPCGAAFSLDAGSGGMVAANAFDFYASQLDGEYGIEFG